MQRAKFGLGVLAAALVVGWTVGAHAQTPDPATVERQRRDILTAAEAGDLSAINRLIIAGGKVNVADETLRTPLYFAVAHNRLAAVKLLLSEGADVNAQARDLDTPWLLAAQLGHAEILRAMLPYKPNPAMFNRFGGSALVAACENAHVDAVRVLLATSTDVNRANDLGWTCLISEALLGDGGPHARDVARLALDAGADPNIRDRRGLSALDYATQRGLTALAALLKAHGAKTAAK